MSHQLYARSWIQLQYMPRSIYGTKLSQRLLQAEQARGTPGSGAQPMSVGFIGFFFCTISID